MSNSNSNNGEQIPKERQEEIALFQRFRNVATAKLERMTNQEDSGVVYEVGDEEKRILTQMQGMGLKEGLAAGAVTLLILRRGPIFIGRYLAKRRQGSGTPGGNSGGFQLSDPSSTATGGNPFRQATNPPPFPRSRNPFIRGIWFAFDVTLSLMMAASVSVQYTDSRKIREGITRLPLVPGKSLVADALCHDLSAELQKVIREENPAYKRLLHESKQTDNKAPLAFYMEGITNFSENCQRRAYREQELRQEQGLSPTDPVEIPVPGVPSDGPRLIQNEDGDDEVAMNDTAFGGETSFGDSDWASDFVQDQNDDSSRRD